MAALLHDVAEDSEVTLSDLRDAGFPPEVLNAVEALTRRGGESRLEAARRAAKDPIALMVKLADVTDNMNLDRIPDPSDKDLARLKEYEQVKELLTAELNRHPGIDASETDPSAERFARKTSEKIQSICRR
jgi:(p)ppGpp synthase/HD superfamily hydrolase